MKVSLKNYQKKLDNLLKEKTELNEIYDSPNNVVFSRVLSNEEYSILKPGLKYGIATRSNESNILTYVEDI